MRKVFFLLIILALLVVLTGCFWNHMESNTTQILQNVWGSEYEDMFAVGGFLSGFITQFDGTAWSEMTVPIPAIGAAAWGFLDVWGTADDDVFAVGWAEGGEGPDHRGIVYHYDGTSWSDMGGDHPKLLQGVWGSAWNDVWAVGGFEDIGLIIEHYDGSTWTTIVEYGPETLLVGLTAIWGSSASDVWAVGDWGWIFHYDGTDWDFIWPPAGVDLKGINGFSSSNVFAVGQGGKILHYDGSTWSWVESGTTKTLFDVMEYWAVGEGGTILFYDNGEWGPYFSPTTEHLYGVWRQSVGTGYACAVGLNGTILDFPNENITSESEGMGMIELESSALLSSNSILSVDTATLGDHVTIMLEVVTDHPLKVEDSLPDELSYIPDTLVISGGPFTCETSEHEISCKLKKAGSYVITFDVQVTYASGLMGMGGFTWPLPSPDDLEGENITVENTVTIGSETTTETLTITPFEGFYKLHSNAWQYEEGTLVYLADPLNVPTNTDVHWDIYLAVYNSPDDAINEMAGVEIIDRLGNGLELDDTVMTVWDGSSLYYDYTDPAKVSGQTQKVKLKWKDVPPLADGGVVAPKLEISTDVNPKMGQQEFADEVLTEHELNSGAVLTFVDPETGLHLRADIPPIVVTADPAWAEE